MSGKKYFYRVLTFTIILIILSGINAHAFNRFIYINNIARFEKKKDVVEAVLNYASKNGFYIMYVDRDFTSPDSIKFFRDLNNLKIPLILQVVFPEEKEGLFAKIKMGSDQLIQTGLEIKKKLDVLRENGVTPAYFVVFDEAGGQKEIHPENRDFALSISEVFSKVSQEIRNVYPAVEVGLFLSKKWWLSEKGRDTLWKMLKERKSLPDFCFIDYYFGWGGKRDDRVSSYPSKILSEMFRLGKPVFLLGQAHTTRNGYTPSKEEIKAMVNLAKEMKVNFMGWYANNAAATDLKKNPHAFDPNDQRGFMFETSRKRWLYANDLLFSN